MHTHFRHNTTYQAHKATWFCLFAPQNLWCSNLLICQPTGGWSPRNQFFNVSPLKRISSCRSEFQHIGTSVRRSSGRRSGGRLLANDVVATILINLFSALCSPFFPSLLPFLIEGVLGSKNGYFGAPWRPFWILQAVGRCRR